MKTLEYRIEVKIERMSTETERVNCPEHWKSSYLTKNQIEEISDLVDKFERINKSFKDIHEKCFYCNDWPEKFDGRCEVCGREKKDLPIKITRDNLEVGSSDFCIINELRMALNSVIDYLKEKK